MTNSLLLVFAALFWGIGFVGTRWTLMDYSPMWANSLRYILAGLLVLPYIIYKKSFFKSRSLLKKTFVGSSLIFWAMFFQTVGVKYTTIAKSGFFTTFYAFFVPVYMMLLYKKRYQKSYWGLVLLALLGVFFLCDLQFDNFNKGDVLIFLSAFIYAYQIIYIDKIAKEFESAFEFNALQCFYMGVMGLVISLIIEGPISLDPVLDYRMLFKQSALNGFLMTAILSSIIAFSIQIHAQKKIAPHIVGLIFLLESPFAAFFGYLLLNEGLSAVNIMGCLLIVSAVAFLPKVRGTFSEHCSKKV